MSSISGTGIEAKKNMLMGRDRPHILLLCFLPFPFPSLATTHSVSLPPSSVLACFR
jgi:hypothetical protein